MIIFLLALIAAILLLGSEVIFALFFLALRLVLIAGFVVACGITVFSVLV